MSKNSSAILPSTDGQRTEQLRSLLSARESVIADLSQFLSTIIAGHILPSGEIRDPASPINRRQVMALHDAYKVDLENALSDYFGSVSQ